MLKCYRCCNSIFVTFSISNLLKWLTLNNRYRNYQRTTDNLARLVLDYQGKFDLVLKTVKHDICEMKTKFTALESELRVSKTITVYYYFSVF